MCVADLYQFVKSILSCPLTMTESIAHLREREQDFLSEQLFLNIIFTYVVLKLQSILKTNQKF